MKNELRIGNKLQVGGQIITVSAIDSSEIGTLEEGYISLCHPQLSGVPLSEDWLIEAGFEEYHTNPRLERFFVLKSGYYPFQIYQDRDGRFWYTPNIPLDFVHRLQNLYHGLYVEELEFKL